MFKTKARVDYGLQIMFELAKHSEQIVSLTNLAKRLGVSSIYLIQIAQSLSKEGLIKSKEGAGGGYYLTRPAKQISVLEIVEALDGKIQVSCNAGQANKNALKNLETCPYQKECQIHSLWIGVIPDLKEVLRKRTLASLFKKN